MKEKQKYSITIDEPCHEKWSDMKTQTNGRFCDSCAKSVIDFTKLSDNEIIRILQNANGKSLCGRFEREQLNKIMVQTNAENNNPALYKILAGLLLLVSVEAASAQTTAHHNETETAQQINTENDIKGKVAMTLVLDGVVLDESGLPLPGATVFSERTRTSVMTDFDGKFSMEIIKGEMLAFSFDGLQTLRLQVDGSKMEIKLKASATANQESYQMGYVIVRRPEKD